jgi:hypothetical protein
MLLRCYRLSIERTPSETWRIKHLKERRVQSNIEGMMPEEVVQSSLEEEALCAAIRRWEDRRHLEGTVIAVLSRPKFRT